VSILRRADTGSSDNLPLLICRYCRSSLPDAPHQEETKEEAKEEAKEEVNVARIVNAPIQFLTEDRLGLLATVILFMAGGLFGDLAENRRDEHTSRGPSERTLVLVQSLGPAALTLLGTIITAAVTLAQEP
jgi:hypothetical protein